MHFHHHSPGGGSGGAEQGAYTCRRGAAVALSTVRCLHDSHANYESVWRLAERDVAYITGPEWSLLIYKRKTLAVD